MWYIQYITWRYDMYIDILENNAALFSYILEMLFRIVFLKAEGQEFISMLLLWNYQPCSPTNRPNFLLHLFAVFLPRVLCNVLRLPWLKAGCNSTSLSRASLECRDPQDHLDLQDLQDPKVCMELAAHQWVLLNSYQVFCCDCYQLFSTVCVSHLYCIMLL